MMEQLIQKVVNNYSLLVAKEAMFERHLEARENADMGDALTLVKIQLGMIESWFSLLDIEERVIFRQVLLGDYDAIIANRTASTKWMCGLIAAGRSPWQIKDAAIKKIVCFAETHSSLTAALFENI